MFKKYYKGPKSDHFDGIRFFNPWNPHLHTFFKVLWWRLTSKPIPWTEVPDHQLFDTPPERVYGYTLRASYVGHATMLLQTQGLNILTDPTWSDRASPFSEYGPKRYAEPGILFDKLPKIDLVLVSHNHYDHLDIATLKSLWERDRPQIVAPLGNDRVIQREAPQIEVITLDWDQSLNIRPDIAVHLTPTQHWSARGFFDKNQALWGAFVITTPGGNIFFCGDSGYGNGFPFHHALKQFGSFRFAMLPIGTYEPRWFMKYAHMNPREALFAHQDLGNPYTTAIHFETFHLSDEGFHTPRKVLEETRVILGIPPEKFRSLSVGETWEVPLV